MSGGEAKPGARAPRAAAGPTALAPLGPTDRFLGTGESGHIARSVIASEAAPEIAHEYDRSIAGNGAAAYAADGLSLTVHGGAQDGAAKTALGGSLIVLKARNSEGRYVDGAVGKCFAYGAQRGQFFAQGDADARAGIRLSGADVVIGGDAKGFAFEYMTGGRAAVLGDPGRWICSGMSGGVVFVRHDPVRGLDEAALRDRLAKGAKVALRPLGDADREALRVLLVRYALALARSGQDAAAAEATRLLDDPDAFRVIRPAGEVVDQTISTE